MSRTKIIAKDIEYLRNPVALDKACYDILNKRKRKVFGGERPLIMQKVLVLELKSMF